MVTITRLMDLRPYGIEPLTGEACGLGMRLLCDVTEKGRLVVGKALGIPDLKLAEAWNEGPPKDPHVGSIMLDPGLYTFLGVFALLESHYKAFLARPRYNLAEVCNRQRWIIGRYDVLDGYDKDLADLARNNVAEGRDKIRSMIGVLRDRIAKEKAELPNVVDVADGAVVYGLYPDETDKIARLKEDITASGWWLREYSYGGTAGDRNVHEMSGRSH